MDWQQFLRFNPLLQFQGVSDNALQYQVSRDLLASNVDPANTLWELEPVKKILRKQQEEGFWKYPKRKTDPREITGYRQLETFRQLGILVEKYLLDKEHPSVRKAADFLFSCQTEEGDFRGIYLDQYSPNYTAAYLEILINAGYTNDKFIEKGLRWLLSIRQDDGGWVVPLRTEHVRWNEVIKLTEPIQPRREKPFSHMITGVVLRAFAAHPKYKRHPEILDIAEKLARRIFKADNYTDRRALEYWTRLTFPFWFTDILSTLDSLSKLGFTAEHPNIEESIEWFEREQKNDGSWSFHLLRGGGEKNYDLWVALVVCKVLKRFSENRNFP